MSEVKGPILYVVVVGFHHKKGCQVEYSYPPLVPGSPNECPPGWKYLPTLALPDGSHNFDEDTVFFHLPSLTKPKQTVYGISCFRQIPVEKIKNVTSDITRGSVQKSVCVLSEIPLFGQIQVKMSLITHAYFDEGDFSKVSILQDTFHHLNSILTQSDFLQQSFVGLSARDFILQWKHKALLLFKLLLLEKRVVFFKSPVHPLCSSILTLISLFPEMVEQGLDQSACIRLSRPMSPMPQFSDDDLSPVKTKTEINPLNNDNGLVQMLPKETVNDKMQVHSTNNFTENGNSTSAQTECAVELTEEHILTNSNQTKEKTADKEKSPEKDANSDIGDIAYKNMIHLASISSELCGFPLKIFTTGYLCLPYLSLSYLDILSDVNVRGYIVGATNILFKQKRQLFDILVDLDSGKIECQDVELRKQLHLTTEDLRFADYVVKHVSAERHDVFLDGVGWEGGDEWIRSLFKVYMVCLIRSSLSSDTNIEVSHFNSSFMTAWRDTHNYKMWLSGVNPAIMDIMVGHPFAGQLSVADMKLRLSHTMQNTDSGRKINQAMVTTGKAVVTTSKAVGGAISQAKGVFSNWWSNLVVNPDPAQKVDEAFDVNQATENLNGDINKTVEYLGDGTEDKLDKINKETKTCIETSNSHIPGSVQTV